MNRKKEYRDNGAIGALLDEYEKSVNELKEIIKNVSPNNLIKIVDNQTKDDDCKSIQTILIHVINSGYNYVIEIRKWLGEGLEYTKRKQLDSIGKYQTALEKMFAFCENLIRDYPGLQLKEHDPDKKIKVRIGQVYDVEQLLEHAIVHVLRHRRQIESFKIKLMKNEAS